MARLIPALVIKVKPAEKTMLVVTEEGDFWEVPLAKPTPEIGVQVAVASPIPALAAGGDSALTATPIPTISSSKRSTTASWPKWLPAVAACFLLFILGGANWLFFAADRHPPGPTAGLAAAAEPAYLVAIDINPSLELWLDDQLAFLGAEALNEEASLLLDKVALKKGTPFLITVQQLVAAAQESNYLAPDRENLIMTTLVKNSATSPQDLVQLNEALDQAETMLLDALEDQGIQAEVALRTGTKEELADARANKLSVNKMFVVKELALQGVAVELSRIQGQKIGKLLQETGVPPGQVLKELKHTSKPAQKVKDRDVPEQIDVQEQIKVMKEELEAKEQNKPEPKLQDKKQKLQEKLPAEKNKPALKDLKNPKIPEMPTIPEIPRLLKPGSFKLTRPLPGINRPAPPPAFSRRQETPGPESSNGNELNRPVLPSVKHPQKPEAPKRQPQQ